MKHIKEFEEFINESNQENVINQILTSLNDDIQYLIGKHEESFEKHYERQMTDYDRELTRLNIIWDMVKSIETYTLPSDALITVTSTISNKGNLEISAKIQRGDIVYNFNTEVIYAGGYNIQRLHYRYITKTDLPKTGSKTISSEYQDKIKKLTKLEKLNLEIESYEDRIKRATIEADENSKLTDDEIIQTIKNSSRNDWYEWPSWKEIVKRDAAKNYNNDEAFYNQQKEDGIKRRIESWKNMNIDWKRKSVIDYQKQINKLKLKLSQMIQ